ncbi:MAG: hypothetical protein A3F17_04160 [Gammaproteobacteria bacterium RIFCSPHIGHO2_12_FULL_41_15]|nr:MAG: hypothetical protein A3F17_04160 [Gammaproteobacteria bacterium RIFCSPHIGHO2_12_FULL_41_15]
MPNRIKSSHSAKKKAQPKKSVKSNQGTRPKKAKTLQKSTTQPKQTSEKKVLPSEKLQKIIATAGLGSRREVETWILAGRVSVNGRLATLGERAVPTDKIRVDGRLIRSQKMSTKTRMIMYYKPEGEICTRKDPEGRRTVYDSLPDLKDGRWINIGRLDINTRGLLLFTNDGELANKLMHPRYQIEREYAIRVKGKITEDMAKVLTEGVMLEDGPARFEHLMSGDITDALNSWYYGVVVEGRNRVVRRLIESQRLEVSRLIRVRYGPISLPKSLKMGRWNEVDAKTVKALCDEALCDEVEQSPDDL